MRRICISSPSESTAHRCTFPITDPPAPPARVIFCSRSAALVSVEHAVFMARAVLVQPGPPAAWRRPESWPIRRLEHVRSPRRGWAAACARTHARTGGGRAHSGTAQGRAEVQGLEGPSCAAAEVKAKRRRRPAWPPRANSRCATPRAAGSARGDSVVLTMMGADQSRCIRWNSINTEQCNDH